MTQVNPLLPVHQSEPMKPLNGIGGLPATNRDVILWPLRHELKELKEALLLPFAGKSILYLVGLAVCHL